LQQNKAFLSILPENNN